MRRTAEEIRQRKEELREAHRDWNHNYRIRQHQKGVPDRRVVAEEIMRTVFVLSKDDLAAREIIRAAGKSLLALETSLGEKRFTKEGVLARWEKLFKEFHAVKR